MDIHMGIRNHLFIDESERRINSRIDFEGQAKNNSVHLSLFLLMNLYC